MWIEPSSPYIVTCKRDGERASVLFNEHGYKIECPACHRAEYGETLEKALKCWEANND